jgi:hypothetical protein
VPVTVVVSRVGLASGVALMRKSEAACEEPDGRLLTLEKTSMLPFEEKSGERF